MKTNFKKACSNSNVKNVLVVTPLGKGGKGGIDRVMDQLRNVAHDDSNFSVSFVTSRGPHILTSILFFPYVCLTILLKKIFNRVDVVHLNVSSHSSLLRKKILGSFCRILHVPYVIHLHGSRFESYWESRPNNAKKAINDFFSNAQTVVVLGSKWKNVVTRNAPAAENRIIIVPNATKSRDQSNNNSDEVNIIFLGRLGQRKGVNDLLTSLAKLPVDLRWKAVIAGDGAIEEMKVAALSLNISHKVEFPGWLNDLETDVLLGKSDILVLPSYDENLPMSVIEGMAAGLAIVTTPVGSTSDIIEHESTGLLVNPGDTQGLYEAILSLITSKPLRTRLGAAAMARHHDYLNLDGYLSRLSLSWKSPSERQ